MLCDLIYMYRLGDCESSAVEAMKRLIMGGYIFSVDSLNP